MKLFAVRISALCVIALGESGCLLRNTINDQVQIDSMTFCDVGDSAIGRPWGRRKGEGGAVWSHYELGTFACRSQDQWLCMARTGQLDTCAGGSMPAQSTDADAKHYRNEAQAEMMMQSDRLCDQYLASVFGTQAGFALQMDVAGSLLSGGAALAKGIAARNLTATSALTGAVKSHVDADIYQGQVANAINILIRKNRSAARQVIRANRACSRDAYTAAEAVADALNYHNLCSFEYGLGELVHEASDTSPIRASVAGAAMAQLQTRLSAVRADAQNAPADQPEAKKQLSAEAVRLQAQIDIYAAFGTSGPIQTVAARTVPAAAPAAPAPVAAPAVATAPIDTGIGARTCDSGNG